MAEEVEVEEGEGKKKGGKGLIIVLIVIVLLLLIGVGVLAWMLLMQGSGEEGDKGDKAEAHAPAEHGDGHGEDHNPHAKQYSPKFKQFEPPLPEAPPGYFKMEKLVVNFNGEGQAKLLAVDLAFMSYYSQVVSDTGEMENLRPILKNDIQRLLRKQQYSVLIKPEGQEVLAKEILKVARNVLEQHQVYPDLLEDVYMTRFIMQ